MAHERILIVEDDYITGMDIRQMVKSSAMSLSGL